MWGINIHEGLQRARTKSSSVTSLTSVLDINVCTFHYLYNMFIWTRIIQNILCVFLGEYNKKLHWTCDKPSIAFVIIAFGGMWVMDKHLFVIGERYPLYGIGWSSPCISEYYFLSIEHCYHKNVSLKNINLFCCAYL